MTGFSLGNYQFQEVPIFQGKNWGWLPKPLSTCQGKPFGEENVYQQRYSFFFFFGRWQNFRPFGKNFSEWLWKLHSLCPVEQSKENHYLWKKTFFICFVQWTNNFRPFSESFSARLSKLQYTYPEKHCENKIFSWKSYIKGCFFVPRELIWEKILLAFQ